MGLDISKITNAELQKLAYLKDGDNNGTLDAEEFAIFKQEAATSGVETKDFNQAMGLYTTNPAAATEATAPTSPTAGMTDKQTKKYQKEADEAHIKYLNAYVSDGLSRQDALKALDSKANLDPEFRQAVADVIALMPATYESSDEINHKELVKKLEEAGIKDDLHEDILKQLEQMAKNECIAAKTSEIADLYAEKMAAAQKNGKTKSSQQIMDEIKKEVKDADNFKGDFKEAYKHFNQPMIDAYNKVYAAIAQITDLEKGGKVQDKAEDILKANGQWDKYTKKALLGDRNIFKRFKSFLTGYKSDGRIASDNQGRWNKVEHKKNQTEQEIRASLGSKGFLFTTLKETGLITQNADGTWDLSKLSEEIGKQVGADAKLNRDAKKDTDTSEIRWTTAKLAALSELSDQLEEKDAKALVKLCGYEIEGKHWGKAIFSGLLGAASGAVLTGGSTLGAAQMLPKRIEVPYYKDKAYDISADLKEAIASGKLPEGVTVDAAGQVHIITDILVSIPRLAGQLGQLGLYAAVPGALVGAALGVASGLKDKGQMPKIPVNFDEMTYEEFAKTVNESKTEYAPVALLIAASFVDKDGNWDRDGYKQFLNTMAGDKNGIINREELIGGLQKRLKEIEKKKEDNVDNNNDDCTETCDVDVKEQAGQETSQTTDKTYIHLRKDNPNVGWKEMVEAYFPGLVEACGGKLYGPNGAIREFQKELCTDENGNFDAAKLKALITATDVPKEIKIPLQVKGIDRVIIKPTPGGRTSYVGNGSGVYRPAMDKVGRDEKVTTKQVGPSTHLATDGCNGHTASGSTPKEAVQNLEKQEKKQYSNRDEYLQ